MGLSRLSRLRPGAQKTVAKEIFILPALGVHRQGWGGGGYSNPKEDLGPYVVPFNSVDLSGSIKLSGEAWKNA
jgi:hypothetical protein